MEDSKPCRFKLFENSRILQDFERFCWNSDQKSQNFRKIHVRLTEHFNITGFPVSSTGGVWIFSGIAHYHISIWTKTCDNCIEMDDSGKGGLTRF